MAYAWSRRSRMSSFGDSGLPVFQAGHCDWQRPHSVQVAKSSRPFQVKSSILPTPKVSVVRVGLLEVERLAVAHHRPQRAEAVGAPGEQDVERRQEDVQVLGVARTMTRNTSMTPMCSSRPTYSSTSLASSPSRLERAADAVGDERPVAVREVARGRRRRPRNRNSVQMTLKIMNRTSQAPPRCEPLKRDSRSERLRGVLDPDGREGDQAEQARRRAMKSCRKPSTAHLPTSGMWKSSAEDQRAVRLEVDGRQDEERPDHEEVRDAGDGPLEQLPLPEDLDDLGLDVLADVVLGGVDTLGRGLAARREPVQEQRPAGRRARAPATVMTAR